MAGGFYRSEQQMAKDAQIVKTNALYVVVVILVVVVVGAGYQLYEERQKTHGVQFSIDKGGISIERK